MQTQTPPRLPDVHWDDFLEFLPVYYTYLSSQYWVCPICDATTTVKRNKCGECGRERLRLRFKIGARGKEHYAWFMRQEKMHVTI